MTPLVCALKGQKLNTNVLLKLVGQPRDIPPKIPADPAKSLVCLGFEGHAELLAPTP